MSNFATVLIIAISIHLQARFWFWLDHGECRFAAELECLAIQIGAAVLRVGRVVR